MVENLRTRYPWIVGVAALVTLLVLTTVSLNPNPKAAAAANRRLCQYVSTVSTDVTIPKAGSTTDNYTVPANLFVAINYKKKGKCPQVEDPYHIGGDSSKAVRLSFPHPEPKDKCQDWGRTIGATGAYRGTISAQDPPLRLAQGDNPLLVDLCGGPMAKDTVYEFYVFSSDTSFADGTTFKKGEFVTNKRDHV
jgi:hypothetical protein